jgi:hypothetical protein
MDDTLPFLFLNKRHYTIVRKRNKYLIVNSGRLWGNNAAALEMSVPEKQKEMTNL